MFRDALSYLASVPEMELNAASEKTPYACEVALTTGDFHAVQQSAVLDHVRNTVSQVASLSAELVSTLMSLANIDLAPFLTEDSGPDPNVTAKEYTTSSAVREFRLLAAPSTAHSAAVVSQGIESPASLASFAVQQSMRAVHLLSVIAETEIVTAARTIRTHGEPPVRRGAKTAFQVAARLLSSEMADRYLTEDPNDATELALKEELH